MSEYDKPSLTLLIKLGSAVVHAEEGLSKDGHPFDIDEFKKLANDPEVLEWRKQMTKLAFLPVKRNK